MPERPPSRLLRLLLRLYPRAYRERYGAEIEAFESEARGGGVLYALRLTADHLAAARAVRRRTKGTGAGERTMHNVKWAWRSPTTA